MDAAATLTKNTQALRTALDQLEPLTEPVQQATQLIRDALLSGGKLLCCGNGGSAADAAHFTSEIAGRYRLDRPGYPALDLTAEHTLVTALSNDYPPAEVFARQVATFARPGDVLIGFSTSGQSANVRLAFEAAGPRQVRTIGFLGRDGGACRHLVEVPLVVPGDETARIQEMHLLIYHTICETLDPILAEHARR